MQSLRRNSGSETLHAGSFEYAGVLSTHRRKKLYWGRCVSLAATDLPDEHV